jgi:hypothetical protein
MAKEEVDEEIKLASEQEAHHGREQQMIEFERNHIFRARQEVEIQKNERHRTEQRMMLTRTQTMKIQEIVQTEGNKSFVRVICVGLCDVLIFHRPSQD